MKENRLKEEKKLKDEYDTDEEPGSRVNGGNDASTKKPTESVQEKVV